MILVIDNYDSFTYNLVHLIAETTSEIVIKRNDEFSIDDVESMNPAGILISPGPGRPSDAGITKDVIRGLGDRIPILGICLGHQAIGEVYGGEVTYAPALMHGKTSQIYHDGKGIFENISLPCIATRYHSLVVSKNNFPADLEITAQTDDGVIMGLRHVRHAIEGIQFHPESLLTTEGPAMIRNWLKAISSRTASVAGNPVQASDSPRKSGPVQASDSPRKSGPIQASDSPRNSAGKAQSTRGK